MFSRVAFYRSVYRVEDLPPDAYAEVAFAGRSNAGKSSAINALANRSRLAFVSKTPGRTQAINFFSLDPGRFLVDLPGYGYAAVSKADRRAWNTLVSTYCHTRHSLRGLILVMDARRPLTELDCQLLSWINALARPAHALLTKADKLTRVQADAALKRTEAELARRFPGCTAQLFSSTRKTGVDEARSIAGAWVQ